MNKLQLYITISFDGFRNMLEINPMQEVKEHVTDIRDAVDEITYDPKDKNIFYLLKYTDKGVFVTVIRTIPDNPSDHLASWIFIPSSIVIGEREIEDIVNAVLRVVSNAKITSEDLTNLRKLFSKSYPEQDEPGATVANFGRQYAHRYFSGDTGYLLSDYIGNKRYQTTYLQYAGVILADKRSVDRIGGPDITDQPLDQMVKIFPPKPDDRPYRPMIFDRPFTHPFLVPLMGTVEIVWESSSAVDIRQSIMINKPNMRPDNISLQSTRPGVGRQTEKADDKPVAVTAPERKPAPESAPKTDDSRPATKGQSTQRDMVVSADPVSEKESAADDPRTINYNRDRLYRFEIPAKSADISGMIHFEIHTRSTITGSPIDGYELTEPIQEGSTRSNHLIYSPSEGLQTKGLWAFVGFVVGILIAVLAQCAFGGSSSSSEEEIYEVEDSTTMITTPSDVEKVTTAQPAQPGQTQAGSAQTTPAKLEDAVKYLDTNKKWTKADLDKYPDLSGLYSDLNGLNRQRIVDYWGPKLKDSRTFAQVVHHCELGLKANKKCRSANGSTFNKEGDTTINVRSFLNTVDP